MFVKFFLVVGLGVPGVKGIISNEHSKQARQESGGQRQGNEIAHSLDREYIAEFEDSEHTGRGGLGPSDHADKHFETGVGDYEDFKGDRYHHQFGQGSHYGDGHFLHHHHYHDHHKHYDDVGYQKALAIKGLLVPLAGVALLGAAAAFISNPVLLQLGIISGVPPLGRRKRDATEPPNISFENKIRSNQIKLLENFMAKVPEENIRMQEKKWLADYLSCSGMNNKKLCIERLACELYSAEGNSMPMEAEVLTIIVNKIFSNDFIPKGTKVEILQAMQAGKNNVTCDMFLCAELEKRTKSQHQIRKKG